MAIAGPAGWSELRPIRDLLQSGQISIVSTLKIIIQIKQFIPLVTFLLNLLCHAFSA